MTESLHPPENKGKNINVTPIVDERLDPNELERYEILEQFLSQCRHPSLRGSEMVSDFIVSTLADNESGGEWGSGLRQLKTNVTEYAEEQFQALRNEDEIFSHIYDLILKTKASVGRKQSISTVRRALLELMDLRGGVIAQFDRSQLTNNRNENAWMGVLDKLVPPSGK